MSIWQDGQVDSTLWWSLPAYVNHAEALLHPRGSSLCGDLRDIRAVHFGSLYLVALFLGLAYAFDRLDVPTWHQAFFPAGLGLLVTFAGVAYLFPRPSDLDPFYYWTRGWPLVLSLIGLACLAVALLWTACVLMVYALAR